MGETWASIGTLIGATIQRQLAVCAIASLLLVAVPALRRGTPLLMASLLAAVFTYQEALPGFLLSNVATFAAAAWFARLDETRRWRASIGAILAGSALFLIAREAALQERATVAAGGITWRLFYLDMWQVLRLVTFLWETGAARVNRPSLATFLLWSALPFTAFGPLLRFAEFEAMQRQPAGGPPPAPDRPSLGVRAMSGVARLCAAGALALLVRATFVTRELELPFWARAVVGVNAPAWGFYLSASGYFLLMEVLARGWGLELPKSFDAPFRKRNLGEFWASWNITVTNVFREYLFFNRWGLPRANLHVNAVLVFVACGLWHGANAYWVLWGALHGVGFGLFIAHRTRHRPDPSRPERAARRWVAVAATYVFVVGCWVVPSKLIVALRPWVGAVEVGEPGR